jgi:pyruvate/2-oxoglutarate dehydrogenase complex dihydrolipoamide acyltransferase (E2) component
MTLLPVPQLGNEITEAEVSEWFRPDGAEVVQGEPVVSISTTKMAIDLEAPASGKLRILIAEGDIAQVGTVLARIE